MAEPFPKGPRVSILNASIPGPMLAGGGVGLSRYDVLIENGTIRRVRPSGARAGDDAAAYDLDGGLILPAFADIHTHLDKGHIWPRRPNPDGTWLSALLSVREEREAAAWGPEDLERRMEFSLRAAYAHGSAAIRTHLDCVPPQDETTWPVLAGVRERWAGRIEIQAVSLVTPDHLLDRVELGRIATLTKQHAGILGGAIQSHAESRQAMRNVVEAAGEHGLDLDIHADECLDPNSRVLLHLAEAVLEAGFEGNVLAGHCCALAVQDEATRRQTIDSVAAAGIAIVSLPMCNLYLMDRDADGRAAPSRRGVTLLKELAAAGVRVALASDNTRDPFYAYGDLDALEVLREGARVLHFDHPQDKSWTWARTVAGDAAGIAGFAHRAEIAEGLSADLVLFRARNWTELLARPQSDRIVLRGGQAIDTTLPDYRELDDLMEA